MPSLFRKLAGLFRRRQNENDLRDELDFYLDEEAKHLEQRGLSPDEARHAAHRKLGNLALVQEDTRATWSWTFLDQLVQDLRYAARTMGSNKTFTALAALSLALGIGANTAIYSFLDALLLRSLPVADPGSLVVLRWHAKPRAMGTDFVLQGGSGHLYDDPSDTVSDIFPYPAVPFFQKAGASVFSDVFTYCHTREVRTLNLSIKGRAEVASGELVSGDYFRGLRVSPASGRLMVPDDDRFGAPAVTVVSHALAEKRLGGAVAAPGQTILIDNLPFTVIGVAPPEFFGVDASQSPEVYLPMHTNVALGASDSFGATQAEYLDQNDYWIQMMARLRPGVTRAQAQAVLGPQFNQWIATTAQNAKQRANLPWLAVEEGATGLDTLRRQFSKPLFVLMTLVGLILAIACSNVANLLLARGASRRREIALRLSLGAGRARVVRQLLTESVLLSAIGGALGVFFAVIGIRFLGVLLATGPRTATIHADLNWHVLAVAIALSLLTGILFGLAPALQSTRLDLASAIKESRLSGNRAHRAPWNIGVGRALVIGQITVVLPMLVAAGLFVRTLSNLASVELGFNREQILLFQVDARRAGHRDPEITDFYATLRRQLASIPGVRRATIAETSLIGADTFLAVTLPGVQPTDGVAVLPSGPDFLTTMQIPLLAGRDFSDRDHRSSQPVAVINQRFARQYFGGQNPLGRHLILWKRDKPARDMEVIGVVRDARYGGMRTDFRPVIYIPYDQGYPEPNDMTFALRTTGDPLAFVNAVRDTVRRADPRMPVSNIETQTAEIAGDMHQETTLADLCTAFAVLALIIACVGLYGTMSYTVTRRTGEIGIRMALGAHRRAVVWMILREVAALAFAGLAISIPAALAASKFIRSFLFGAKPNDPLTLACAAAVLLAAALLAGYIPARRASRIDPMAALRNE